MKFALFLGCNIPVRLKQYETSSRAVLDGLGVTLVDIPEFGCCGYPLRNIDLKAFVLSSSRNLALAEKHNLDMIVLCKCGYGTLRMAQHLMSENTSLREDVNAILAKEGLKYKGEIRVKHLFKVLFNDVGTEAIKEKVTRPYQNLRVATHYGCHALRPSSIVQFDDPVAPTIFDQLVEVTGAESIDWPTKLGCCGGPLLGIHDDLSFDFTEKKLDDAKRAGAHYMTTGCVFCQIQFDSVRENVKRGSSSKHYVPSILYSQLLGLCMDIDKELLGLDGNQADVSGLEGLLAAHVPLLKSA
jgi:heterodisulfide reductase subunit B